MLSLFSIKHGDRIIQTFIWIYNGKAKYLGYAFYTARTWDNT